MQMMMKMNVFHPTNIAEKLANAKTQDHALIDAVNAFIAQPNTTNDFDLDQLESKDIYHIDTIKDICINYRLRFLDLKYFKNDLPQEAFDKIAALEVEHNTTLSGFKIMAPSKLFRLKDTDDPLLFVPLGNDYLYLIHHWGVYLHPFRNALVWPFKNIWNLMVLILGISWVATQLTPLQYSANKLMVDLLDDLLYVKAIASVVLFYGFALGKNFNPAIWNSKYNKS